MLKASSWSESEIKQVTFFRLRKEIVAFAKCERQTSLTNMKLPLSTKKYRGPFNSLCNAILICPTFILDDVSESEKYDWPYLNVHIKYLSSQHHKAYVFALDDILMFKSMYFLPR